MDYGTFVEAVIGVALVYNFVALNAVAYKMTSDDLRNGSRTPEGVRDKMENRPLPKAMRPLFYPGMKLALRNYEKTGID